MSCLRRKIPGSPRVYNSRSERAWERSYSKKCPIQTLHGLKSQECLAGLLLYSQRNWQCFSGSLWEEPTSGGKVETRGYLLQAGIFPCNQSVQPGAQSEEEKEENIGKRRGWWSEGGGEGGRERGRADFACYSWWDDAGRRAKNRVWVLSWSAWCSQHQLHILWYVMRAYILARAHKNGWLEEECVAP